MELEARLKRSGDERVSTLAISPCQNSRVPHIRASQPPRSRRPAAVATRRRGVAALARRDLGPEFRTKSCFHPGLHVRRVDAIREVCPAAKSVQTKRSHRDDQIRRVRAHGRGSRGEIRHSHNRTIGARKQSGRHDAHQPAEFVEHRSAPSTTSTAPTGTSPAAPASRACSSARCTNAVSSMDRSSELIIAQSCGAPGLQCPGASVRVCMWVWFARIPAIGLHRASFRLDRHTRRPYQCPAFRQPPAASRQPPAASRQPPARMYDPPRGSHQRTSPQRLHPFRHHQLCSACGVL